MISTYRLLSIKYMVLNIKELRMIFFLKYLSRALEFFKDL